MVQHIVRLMEQLLLQFVGQGMLPVTHIADLVKYQHHKGLQGFQVSFGVSPTHQLERSVYRLGAELLRQSVAASVLVLRSAMIALNSRYWLQTSCRQRLGQSLQQVQLNDGQHFLQTQLRHLKMRERLAVLPLLLQRLATQFGVDRLSSRLFFAGLLHMQLCLVRLGCHIDQCIGCKSVQLQTVCFARLGQVEQEKQVKDLQMRLKGQLGQSSQCHHQCFVAELLVRCLLVLIMLVVE